MPELRADGLGVDEFVWMMPEEQAHLYTPSGIEGVAHTWQEDPKAMLRAGGATRLAELAAGTPFRYPKKENSVANQELARRVLQHVDGAEVGRERPQPTPAAAHPGRSPPPTPGRSPPPRPPVALGFGAWAALRSLGARLRPPGRSGSRWCRRRCRELAWHGCWRAGVARG